MKNRKQLTSKAASKDTSWSKIATSTTEVKPDPTVNVWKGKSSSTNHGGKPSHNKVKSSPPDVAKKTGAALPSTKKQSLNKKRTKHIPKEIYESRLRFAWMNLMGQKVIVEHASGVKVEGIFHSSNPPNYIINLKMPKVIFIPKGAKKPDLPAMGESLPIENFVDIQGVDVIFKEGGDLDEATDDDSIMTDAAISGKARTDLIGRKLEAATSWIGEGTTATTSSSEGLGGSSEKWDQFATNEKLFGVKNTYSEDLYTSKLDTSSLTPAQIEFAIKKEREISKSKSASRFHHNDGRTEEERYSGVVRTKNQNQSQSKNSKAPPGLPATAATASAREKRVNALKLKPNTRASNISKTKDRAQTTADLKAFSEKISTISESDSVVLEEDNTKKTAAVTTTKTEVKADSKKLNQNAKAFSFSASAKSFVPKPAPVVAAASSYSPAAHMISGHPQHPGMGSYGAYQHQYHPAGPPPPTTTSTYIMSSFPGYQPGYQPGYPGVSNLGFNPNMMQQGRGPPPPQHVMHHGMHGMPVHHQQGGGYPPRHQLQFPSNNIQPPLSSAAGSTAGHYAARGSPHQTRRMPPSQ